jgi:hypothetical protein
VQELLEQRGDRALLLIRGGQLRRGRVQVEKSLLRDANVSLTRSKSLGDDTFFSRSVISTSI